MLSTVAHYCPSIPLLSHMHHHAVLPHCHVHYLGCSFRGAPVLITWSVIILCGAPLCGILFRTCSSVFPLARGKPHYNCSPTLLITVAWQRAMGKSSFVVATLVGHVFKCLCFFQLLDSIVRAESEKIPPRATWQVTPPSHLMRSDAPFSDFNPNSVLWVTFSIRHPTFWGYNHFKPISACSFSLYI